MPRAKKKIAVLGCGKMGTILLKSFLDRKLITPGEAVATVQHGERAQALSKELGGVPVGTDNRSAVAGAAIVLLCVKPQALGQLLDEIAPAIDPGTLVISIAASTTASFIQQKLGKSVPVVRAMPNTPAMVGAAMTAVCAGPVALPQHLETAKHFLKAWAAIDRGRKTHGRNYRAFRQRAGVRVCDSGVARRSRREGRPAA